MAQCSIEVIRPNVLLDPAEEPTAAFARIWELLPTQRRHLWATVGDDSGALFIKGLLSLRGWTPSGYDEGWRTAREWRQLPQLAARGLPVPDLVAFGQETMGFFPLRSFLIQRQIPGARNLDVWLEESGADAATRASVFDQLGELVGQMHAAGVFHRDLACRNVLVTESNELVLIDCPRALIDPGGWRVPTLWRGDLFRIVKGCLRAGASEAELQHFLDALDAQGKPAPRETLLEVARERAPNRHRGRDMRLRRFLVTGS